MNHENPKPAPTTSRPPPPKSQVAPNPIAERMVDMVQKKLIAELYAGLLEMRDDCGDDLIEQVQQLIDKIETFEQHRV